VDICIECVATEAGQWTDIDLSVLFTDVQQFGIKYICVKCKNVTTIVVESSQDIETFESTEHAVQYLALHLYLRLFHQTAYIGH